MNKKLFVLILAICLIPIIKAQELRKEFFRPQFHLSPSYNWMGDPDGTVFFNGQYHLLWWGHAKSEDLVHWTEYNLNAMNGGPGDFTYFTGSVVVDTANTAGFNTAEDTAMVAIYTMHYSNDIEKVGLSISHNHSGFNYYEGNAVIDVEQKFFRDPSVFWHEETSRWIMAITRCDNPSVEFYHSSDLKTWDYLSKFNLRGATGWWEVPDLFELPLNGNENNKKWVLSCGIGPNQIQYWIGNFDGTYFTLDSLDNHFTGNNIPGEIFADFNGEDYGNWQVSGTAFGNAPAEGTLPDQQKVNSYIGKGLVNTYNGGDASTGKLISPEFTIEKRFINYLIGGGKSSSTQIRLIINNETVLSGTSLEDQESLRWDGWNVSDWIGAIAHIEIVDEATGGWGHILVDHIVFSEVLIDHGKEHANWFDWGKDFYAARTYRNYSHNENTNKIWIGWMGNWDYANNVPTVGWQGNQSIPRTLSLLYDEEAGYRITQTPIQALQTIRIDNYTLSNKDISGTMPMDGFQPDWNVFELKTSFKINSKDQVFGINLAEDGSGKKLVIGFDANTSQLYVDRRNAGTTAFSSSFPTICYAPVTISADSILDLHIFMDQSSVEVFANNYQTVMSLLVYTKPSETGISLFSENETTTLLDFQAWNINSIWGVTPDELPGGSTLNQNRDEKSFNIYPNPVSRGNPLFISSSDNIIILKGELEIIDMFGKVIHIQKLSNTTLSEFKIDHFTSYAPTGQYIIQLKTDSFSMFKKILVQ